MSASWKVLAALDLQADSEEVVRDALSFATAFSADVEFLYVNQPGVSLVHGVEWPPSALRPPSYEVDVSRRVVFGTGLAPTIAARAAAVEADFIWIAAHRYGKWNRFWRKSVVDELMASTSLPVCIARENESSGYFKFRKRRILCALGLDGQDESLVAHAGRIAERTAAELVLLHVAPEISEGMLHAAADGGRRPLTSQLAAEKLAAIARKLPVPVTTSAMTGDAASCIALAAREHAADLVLMGRDSALSRAAYGWDVERLFGRLRGPLVTVPVDAVATVQAPAIRKLSPKVIRLRERVRDFATAGARRSDDEAAVAVLPLRYRSRR
jgi:nucleotide-binding universal stress UspA family protein